MEILCFLAGLLFFYTKNYYLFLSIALCFLFKANRWVIVWFLSGIAIAIIHSHSKAPSLTPGQTEIIAQALLQGEVYSVVKQNQEKAQLYFNVDTLNDKKVQALVYLTCYKNCPVFLAGQRWLFNAKLKRPHNLSNPGGFNYQRYLQTRHVEWVGFIKPQGLKLLGMRQNLGALREKLGHHLETLIGNREVVAIVQALSLGITGAVSQGEWELFRHTGTTHLLVISGAHISLMVGLGYAFFKLLWTRYPRLCLLIPVPQLAGAGGLLVGIGYALLAGLSIPTQRALMSALFFILPNFFYQRFTAWQSWRYALLATAILEPHAVLSPGFYLSFLAVAILIMSASRFYAYSGLKKLLIMQAACLIGLMPFTLFWFSYGALNSMIANLLAIPLVSYLIVPLSLFTLFLTLYFPEQYLTWPLCYSIEGLLSFLKWIDKTAFLNLTFGLNAMSLVAALMLIISIVIFIPLRALTPALLTLTVSLLFPFYPQTPLNSVDIHVLDVGQGLAVVVQTANHLLVYDTGAKFFNGGDMGTRALIPYLKTLGIKFIDTIVISHPDLDHRGGLASLIQQYPYNQLLVNDRSYYQNSYNCHDYSAWEWDGVSFQFLPILKKFSDKNNTSCVLKVSITGQERGVLLTGDIERAAEAYLVEHYPKELDNSVLVIPHHGSKTSSSELFLKAIKPEHAIISAGFDNRFHFPHRQTVTTLQKFHATIWNTIDCGMVSLRLPSVDSLKIQCFKPL